MKLPGCCTLCGAEVFEIAARWPRDHPLAGEPRSVGHPKEEAMRVTLLLASGRQAPTTICDGCEVTPETLPELWRNVKQAFARDLDPEIRRAMGHAEIEDPERAEAIRATVLKIVRDLPVGVIATERWAEVIHGGP